MPDFGREVEALIRARYPIVYAVTWEEARLERKQIRAAARWNTSSIALIRVPLLLFSLIFGLWGVGLYLLATAAYEVYTRADFGDVWWQLRQRRRGAAQARLPD